MPVRVSMKSDYARFGVMADSIGNKILPYAAAAALTDCAKAAKADIVAAMPKIFDRPTDWTKNGLVVIAATKSSLNAAVKVKDIQARYLLLEEEGGTRDPSMTINGKGKVLLVPGRGLKLDRFGNIPRGFLAKALVAAKAPASPQRGRKGRAKTLQGIFVMMGHGPGGRGPGGVFQRLPNHKITRLISFVSAEHFKPRFGYHAQVTKAAKRVFAPAMKQRVREMVVKAKDW